VLSEDEISQKLSTGTQYEKRQLMLTQIGYLRINLFQEHYERIQASIESQEPDKAVLLMNQYIQAIALPFIQQRLNPSITTRIANLFSTSTLPDAAETLKEWQTSYDEWNKQPENKTIGSGQTEKVEQMKKTFITLYTLSFSPSNFPPVAVEPSH
jgi:outer membrane translocation and assembly module TamA